MKNARDLSDEDLGKVFHTPNDSDGGCGALRKHPDGYLYLDAQTTETWELRLSDDTVVEQVVQPLDHLELLKKYMRLVDASFGEDALPDEGGGYPRFDLSAEDVEELHRIAQEARNE